MAPKCLSCGKPLGSSVGLCYSCEQEGADIRDFIDVDDQVKDRVERYFTIASVRCSRCGDLHGEVNLDGEIYTASSFGIDSVEEWELEMDKEEEWIRENEDGVRQALYLLEEDWPHSVKAVRDQVLS
ncbi:MAG: hypothetical protein SV377_06030 [Halobacteria archaeon]|nr:hypothetical protein [Halobacteria archaeon]